MSSRTHSISTLVVPLTRFIWPNSMKNSQPHAVVTACNVENQTFITINLRLINFFHQRKLYFDSLRVANSLAKYDYQLIKMRCNQSNVNFSLRFHGDIYMSQHFSIDTFFERFKVFLARWWTVPFSTRRNFFFLSFESFIRFTQNLLRILNADFVNCFVVCLSLWDCLSIMKKKKLFKKHSCGWALNLCHSFAWRHSKIRTVNSNIWFSNSIKVWQSWCL